MAWLQLLRMQVHRFGAILTLTIYDTIGERKLSYCVEDELPLLPLHVDNTTFDVHPIKDIRILQLELGLH